MQKSAPSTFSAFQKDALLDQFKAIVEAGELTPRSDSEDRQWARWDSAIDRIAIKYGLHLDDWKRLGPNQMGKPCGRGWVGLRGACKRGKKSDDNTEKIKVSKVELADKIRAKKGMPDRNAPKIEPTIPSTRTKAKAVRATVIPGSVAAQEKPTRPPLESIPVFKGNYDDLNTRQTIDLRSGDSLLTILERRAVSPPFRFLNTLDIMFSVNSNYIAGSARNAAQVMYAAKSSLRSEIAKLPDGVLLYNKPTTEDGKGDERSRVYKKAGFGERDEAGGMHGVVIKGKIWPLTQDEYKVLLRD